MVLPLTLECPYVRHKYIEIHGISLLNTSDILIASSLVPNIEQLANEECYASLVQANDKPAKCEVSLQALPQDGSIDQMEKIVTFDCRKALGDPSKNKKTSKLHISSLTRTPLQYRHLSLIQISLAQTLLCNTDTSL